MEWFIVSVGANIILLWVVDHLLYKNSFLRAKVHELQDLMRSKQDSQGVPMMSAEMDEVEDFYGWKKTESVPPKAVNEPQRPEWDELIPVELPEGSQFIEKVIGEGQKTATQPELMQTMLEPGRHVLELVVLEKQADDLALCQVANTSIEILLNHPDLAVLEVSEIFTAEILVSDHRTRRVLRVFDGSEELLAAEG